MFGYVWLQKNGQWPSWPHSGCLHHRFWTNSNEPKSAKICIQIQICPNSAASRPMLVACPQRGFPVPLPRASNAETEWKACCHQASWGSNWPTCGRPHRQPMANGSPETRNVSVVNLLIFGSPTWVKIFLNLNILKRSLNHGSILVPGHAR